MSQDEIVLANHSPYRPFALLERGHLTSFEENFLWPYHGDFVPKAAPNLDHYHSPYQRRCSHSTMESSQGDQEMEQLHRLSDQYQPDVEVVTI